MPALLNTSIVTGHLYKPNRASQLFYCTRTLKVLAKPEVMFSSFSFFSFLLWLGPLVSSFYSVEAYCLPTSEETAVSCPEEESNCCKKFCYYLHKITYSVLFLFELLPYPLWLRHCCPLGLLCSHRTHVLRFKKKFFLAGSFGSLSPKSLMKSCDWKFIYYYLDWRSFIFSLY